MSMAEKLKAYMGTTAQKIAKAPIPLPGEDKYPMEFNRILGGVTVDTPQGKHLVADNAYRVSEYFPGNNGAHDKGRCLSKI